MCNLYSLTKGQVAIRDWFRARHDHSGNLPLFPDRMALIVRNGTNGARDLVMARWGMPGAPIRWSSDYDIRKVSRAAAKLIETLLRSRG
jgi:putative SOS response-associated peptidase YedK